MTGAFALATLVVLAAVGAFVHAQVRADLDEALDAGLHARVADLVALAARTGTLGGAGGVEGEEAFAQLLDGRGRVTGRYGAARGAALTAAEAARAPLTVERHVGGVDGTARMVARPVPGRDLVVVAGASLEDRDETLTGLVAAFALAGPLAVAAASAIGWILAGLGLAPVEAMRSRAARISLSAPGERLPLPAARDEIHRLGQTLNDMLARLEGAFERERRFVADASHELRTPLTVMKAEIETALRTATDPDVREPLAAALAEVDQLAQMADDLLLLARAGEGGMALELEALDVRELLEQARTRFLARADAEGREIRVEAPAGLHAEGDPVRLRQALGNLVDNALRHGAGAIDLVARADGHTLRITVRDDGGGVDEDAAFERFARGPAARGASGAGLGLAIVRAVAEAHGGSAGLDGAAVEVRLPLSSPSQPGG